MDAKLLKLRKEIYDFLIEKAKTYPFSLQDIANEAHMALAEIEQNDELHKEYQSVWVL